VNKMLAANKKTQACEGLDSFRNQVDAQDGKGLYDWQAAWLRWTAAQIKIVIGC